VIFVATAVQHMDARRGQAAAAAGTATTGAGAGLPGRNPVLSTFVIPTADADDTDYDAPDSALNLSEAEKQEIFRMHAEGNIYHKVL
jgi:hypothetical protein